VKNKKPKLSIRLRNISFDIFTEDVGGLHNFDLLLDGKKIGGFSIHEWYDHSGVSLYSVKIQKKYRNKGYGTRMMNSIIKKIVPTVWKKAKKIDLVVRKDNNIAIGIYKRCGFRKSKGVVLTGYNYPAVSMTRTMA
jgi:ribosomal protein S18 acetylase RimI-like enzyme